MESVVWEKIVFRLEMAQEDEHANGDAAAPPEGIEMTTVDLSSPLPVRNTPPGSPPAATSAVAPGVR